VNLIVCPMLVIFITFVEIIAAYYFSNNVMHVQLKLECIACGYSSRIFDVGVAPLAECRACNRKVAQFRSWSQ